MTNRKRIDVQERANKEQKDYVIFDVPEVGRFGLFCKLENFTEQAYHANVQIIKPSND